MEDSSSSEEEQRDASAFPCERGRFRLRKEDRIRRSSEYRLIYAEGVRYRTAHFHIFALNNGLGRNRLGIAAGRRVGKACTRNRIKRVLREFFRLNREILPPGADIVFVALRGAVNLDTRHIFKELRLFFEKKSRAWSKES